jgi:hypothetical protein
LKVARQNLVLIASWPAKECGQTSHAIAVFGVALSGNRCSRSVSMRASPWVVMDVGAAERVIVAKA